MRTNEFHPLVIITSPSSRPNKQFVGLRLVLNCIHTWSSATPAKGMLSLAFILLACSTTGLYAQAPQFTQSLYQTSVNETAVDEGYPRPSNGFLRVTCTAGMNTSYSISITDPLPFDIDSSTGDLSVTEDLDYDTGTTSYSFTVLCSERDSPDLNDTATVEIALLPVNEYRPQVPPGMTVAFVFVPEDTPVGTVIASNSDTAPPDTLYEYTITDNDAGVDGTLIFTFEGLDTEYFTLEQQTGSILLRRELDLDNQTDPAPASSVVTVTGCDFFPPIDTCPNVNLRIFVSQVNEFTPQFSQDSYSTSIPEDTPEGTEVLVVECTDNDVGDRQFARIEFYNASQAVVDAFAIDGSSGNITIRSVNNQNYEFMVRCVDTGGLENFAEVTIDIEDINDNSPACDTGNVSPTLSVGTYSSTTLFTLSCSDLDSGQNALLSYEISQATPQDTRLAIDTATGEVTFTGTLEATGTIVYVLTIVVSDSGNTPLSVSVTITVTLSVTPDVNEFTPQISQDSYSTSIPEDTPEGTEVLVVECTDGDVGVGQFAGIELYNASRAVMDAFAIDGSNGNITVRAVNYETDQSYEFMVRCVDTGGLEDFAEVTINIQDVNDNSPVCDQPNNISTTLSVGTYNYTSLFALLCTDQDTGANGVLQYEITQINPNGSPFMINIDDATGEVGYQGILETTGVYRYKVTIMVSDTGTIPLSVSVDVLVLIEVIPSCSYTNGLELTLPVGSHNLSSVLNVSCTGNDQLSYSIVQNNLGYFEIDGTTGEVTFSGTPAYDLTIRVSDPSGLYLELENITVTITSTNQNGPSDQDSTDSSFFILIALLALLLLTTVVLCVVLLAVWLRFRRRYNGVITDTVATGGGIISLQQSSHFSGTNMEMRECPAYVVSNQDTIAIAEDDNMPHMYESIPGLSPPQSQQSIPGLSPPQIQQSIPRLRVSPPQSQQSIPGLSPPHTQQSIPGLSPPQHTGMEYSSEGYVNESLSDQQ